MKPARTFIATVVTAGRMPKAVKVRTHKQHWNSRVQKHFTNPVLPLVADPTSALRAGDVIRIAPEVYSRHIKHVVTEIISPWGAGIDERPKVLSNEERAALRAEKRAQKVARREARGKGEVDEREEWLEEEEVDGKKKDRRTSEGVKKVETLREKNLRTVEEAERIPGILDVRKLDIGKVEEKMEAARI